jgi:hypothetical protein
MDERLRNRWIGRGDPLEWPPRSPSLTPMFLCLWGLGRPMSTAPPPPAANNITRAEDTDQRGLCKHGSENSPQRVAGG